MPRILIGPEVEPLSGKDLRSLVLMLHGVGADGNNLIDLAQYFAQDFPDACFIAPNAPEAYSLGIGGYQWFPYWERTHKQIIDGLQKASETLSQYIYQMLDEYSLQPEDLILMGFSQGAMVATHTALTLQDNCAGVVSFSGGLLKVEMSSFEVRSQPPICLIHGELDDVVPAQMSEVAVDILDELKVPVEFHKIPNLGHSIDMQGIQIAKGFLTKVMK